MEKNKKANITLETIIFILLNLVFFVVMLVFAYSSGDKEFVYEQTLAKEVALIIDNAKPNTIISLDIDKYADLAEKNKQHMEKIIQLNKKENSVEVNLKQKGGYSYQYFSDYEVSLKTEKTLLTIIIK
ncbi:MAG: hypothetical protein AABW67_01185 [Nanoarchaeota archaeon]